MIRVKKTGISLLIAFLVATGAQARQTGFNVIDDKHGWGMTVTAMAVVFLALLLLYLFSQIIGSIAVILSRKRVMRASGLSKEEARTVASGSGEIFAAIAMAISEITEDAHDDENTVLTIKNVARNYSPWSSKIYTLRELPRK